MFGCGRSIAFLGMHECRGWVTMMQVDKGGGWETTRENLTELWEAPVERDL